MEIYSSTRSLNFAHDPFKAIVAPRPVGWITARSAAGKINLSPYSFFNAVSSRPNLVMFCSEGLKDAITFIGETSEFTCSLVNRELIQQMNLTSAPLPRGESEFDHAGLAMAECRNVRTPRVAASPAALECKLVSIQRLTNAQQRPASHWMVIGEVVGIFISDEFVHDGRFDTAKANPVARCGYADYAEVTELFSITRPPGAD